VDSLVLLPAVLVEIANRQPGSGEVVSFEFRRSFEGQTTPKMAI
jgi:hypothetical protein